MQLRAVSVLLLLLVLASQSAQTQTFSVLSIPLRAVRTGENRCPLEVWFWTTRATSTATQGGDLACNENNEFPGCGIVFKVRMTGKKTLVHAFSGGTDGNSPEAGLIRDSAGTLYGTTAYGGDPNCSGNPAGCGTVFKLTGGGDRQALCEASSYFPGCGVVFKIVL
jgi:hypothetical protein